MLQEALEEKLHVIHVDPRDQLAGVLKRVQETPSDVPLLVLSGTASQRHAFRHIHDFRILTTQKKHIALVIPEADRLARYLAKEHGFSPIFSSLEDARDQITLLQSERVDTQQRDLFPTRPPSTLRDTKPLQQKRPSQRSMRFPLVALSILTILTAVFFVFVQQQLTPYMLSQSPPPAPVIVGQVAFESSRIYNQEGTSGVSDQVHLALQHVLPPKSGNTYYAWLLGDKNVSDGRPRLLGTLFPHNGFAELIYRDPEHHNLLATYSQFLLTEESQSSAPPIVPSPNSHARRYSGSIAQIPSSSDSRHFSFLDHLRHLLVQDPTLEPLGLHSGLDYWQYKNCGKLIEWTQSARDEWGHADVSLMRRQLIRTLDYIDGTAYVYQDVSVKTPLLVDPTLLRMGLINVSPTQAVEGFFPHIASHLTSVATSPGVTTRQTQIAARAVTAINGIIHMLGQARYDAKALIAMSDAQLHQPAAQTLLSELANVTNDVYTGNTQQQGCVWLHQQIEQLAAFSIERAEEQKDGPGK
ncbi:hypothetical protein KDA_49250 [Dictyobacter alpinus]|uniref:Uncharacterized protein n=1 Tax=Dictyobacter alpinus TaxID=2014873 RepID=A0A402BDG0_9CHLR|nr:hypothetical protein [Dictyobacter alpinus]GCE29441.1 hypothetical protein KDA_49250 [Dictyobacter alpinus]